jgi:lipid-binding SYLF domain-containing protein
MSKTRGILVAAVVAMLAMAAGCTTTSGSSDPDQRRAAIEAGVDDAIATLFREVAGSRELVSQARGVLVFPDVLEAGFMIAAARGSGALRVGGVTKSYHATTSGSFGLQAGAQSTAVFLLFMTDDALTRFENSSGWTVGADASVTLLTAGASAQVTTATAQQPVIGFVLANRGLMAGISLDGARITRLNL